MVGQLRMVVGRIQESAGSLDGSATSFSATAQQMSTSGEEIAAATEHIAKGAELQVEVVERASAQIRQGAAAVARIAERARLAAEASAAAGDTAQRGGAAAAEALGKMRTVFERMEGSAGLVHGFGERTQKIGKIVEVITGISQQTNLLALNAAIEAAHAGEYGRGFSVVADEIRKLSEATRRSAEEITALVGEIGKESTRVLSTMEAGTLEIREGREVIDTVRGSLDRIIQATVEVAQGVREISTLAGDQARGADEMVKATEEISRIAEDNAAATQEASAATEELTASLEQMAGSAHDLAQLAGGLRQMAASGLGRKSRLGWRSKCGIRCIRNAAGITCDAWAIACTNPGRAMPKPSRKPRRLSKNARRPCRHTKTKPPGRDGRTVGRR